MEFRRYRQFCLCSLGGAFPADSTQVTQPFAPLVLLVSRDAARSRGWFAVSSIDEALEPEGVCNLFPAPPCDAPELLRTFVAQNGATVLNTAFSNAFRFLEAEKKTTGLTATLVGLGDVGGTLLIALKLLGTEFSTLRIYDPNTALCARYEMELNQVLPPDGRALARVIVADADTLFDCDVFLFTATRGVPPLEAKLVDVRMAQYARNREMLTAYAKKARQARFTGLFFQISDPVDQLTRAVFLDSNRNEQGKFDACGLLPEQLQGFGLGVMAARAAYAAEKKQIDFTNGRVYGPHGSGLVVANSVIAYDDALSRMLTQAAVNANLRVRELGFKPYIAPALSSAATSILWLLRGQTHYGAVPLGGVYFGCQSRMTARGLSVLREALPPLLAQRVCAAHRKLEEFCYD